VPRDSQCIVSRSPVTDRWRRPDPTLQPPLAAATKQVTEEAAGDIEKDVARTFPATKRFAGEEGQRALWRVLRAYAALDPVRCAVCCAVPCAVSCCAVLCFALLCCALLCCAVLCCAVLCCAVLCCAVLWSSSSLHPLSRPLHYSHKLLATPSTPLEPC